jgi:hypothetical protein
MSNNFECALEGDEAYVQTDAWEIGGISMQGVYTSDEDLSFDDDDDYVDETKESTAGPALGGWSFATQADVASAGCVGGHHKVTPNQSASTQVTRKPPSRPMTAPVNKRKPGQHGSMLRRGELRPGGSVRMMPGPMAGARRSTNMTAGDSAKTVAPASVSPRQTGTTTLLMAGQRAGKHNKPEVAKTSGLVAGGHGQVAAGIRSQQEADEEKVDTTTERVETKPKAVKTTSKAVETKTEHVETKTEQVETKPEHVETKTQAVETKAEQVETKTDEQVYTKPEIVETKTAHVGTKTKAVDTKAEQVEATTEHDGTKTEQQDTKPEQVETKPEHVETKGEQVDTTTEHREDADCVQLVHKEATLCLEALKQAKYESVHEMNETRQHDEGKQECDVELAEQCETIPSPNNQATVSVRVSLEDELETSATLPDVAAPACEQTIANHTHHKNVESTTPPMNGKRNRSSRGCFLRVVGVLARGYMYLRTHATWRSTSTGK